jgi:hypothetical protein
MIIPITRHLARAAHKANYDLKHGRITEDEALILIDPYAEVLDRLEKRETPARKESEPGRR